MRHVRLGLAQINTTVGDLTGNAELVREYLRRGREAGCDIVLHCNGKRPEMEDAIAAAGPLSDPALARAEAALARRCDPEPIDTGALEAEFASLLMQRTDG